MKGRSKRIDATAVVFFTLFLTMGTTARAGEKEPRYRPSGYADLYTGGMAGFDMNFVIGDDITGYVPSFQAQYGYENLSVGMQWGLAYTDANYFEFKGDLYPGNFIVNFRAKKCMEGAWKTCIGTNSSLGIGAFELDGNEGLSMWAGMIAYTFRYARYAPEALVIDPLFAVNTTNGTVFMQFAAGPSIIFVLDDKSSDAMEAALVYTAETGVLAADLVSIGIAVRGVTTLTTSSNESFLSFDINLRLALGDMSPGVRVSLPFSSSDFMSRYFDLVVAAGLVADF